MAHRDEDSRHSNIGDPYDARVTEPFIRKLIWAYFFSLVIGEGVLRKWVLPSFRSYFARPKFIVIWIYYLTRLGFH